MKERMERRLDELRQEYDDGHRMLAELEQKRLNLEQTLLRISGAIQVLEELVHEDAAEGNGEALEGAHAPRGAPA